MIGKLYYVRCDGCGAPCGGTDALRDTTALARSVARRKGWFRRSGRGAELAADFCPDCAPPPAVLTTKETPDA